jgi:hypothetical protein
LGQKERLLRGNGIERHRWVWGVSRAGGGAHRIFS